MLDIKFVVAHPEETKRGIANRGHDDSVVDRLIALYKDRNELIFRADNLKKDRNEISKQVAAAKKAGEDAQSIIDKTREISNEIGGLDGRIREISAKLEEEMLGVPNLPLPDVPVGADPDKDNKLVRTWGERVKFSFPPKIHWELGESLGLFDLERGARMSGSGHILFTGWGARLQRGLIQLMLDLHTREHGYQEVWPPYFVKRETMTGTGQLPTLESDMYHIGTDDLFPIPTAEVPVTNIYRDEVLDAHQLPKKFVAHTPCFRRESGSYGKDTRGLIRVHQFEKVELVKLCRPEDSEAEHEALLADAEAVAQRLGLEYRVVLLCTTDPGFAAAKCYDVETWAPGLERWLEVSSVSVYQDFQARRCNTRFKEHKGKPQYVHTINGSALALPRIIITFLETYQQEDGTVTIPEVLRPYVGGAEVIEAAE